MDLIVWISGPSVGEKHDSGVIFRKGLSTKLFEDEAAECDAGCGDDRKLQTQDMGEHRVDRKMKANVRAQHEAVNSRLKQFNVLTTHFRHETKQRRNDEEAQDVLHGCCCHHSTQVHAWNENLWGCGLRCCLLAIIDRLPAPTD